MIRIRARFVVPCVVCLVAGCSSARRPEVRAVNVRISSIDFSGIGVVFNVDVYNPYPIRLKTPKFRYGIDIAETTFMQSEHPTEIDLPAGGVGTMPLPLRMDYAKLWEAYAKLQHAGEIAYRLHGAIIVTTLDYPWDVPLEYKGTLPILRPPSFSSPRVSFADVSLNAARVALEVDVHNPNICGIGLADVVYNLALGQVQVANVRAATAGELAGRSDGRLSLTGEIAAKGALLQLVQGRTLGEPSLTCAGAIQTPYGSVPLRPGLMGFEP